MLSSLCLHNSGKTKLDACHFCLRDIHLNYLLRDVPCFAEGNTLQMQSIR